MKKNLLIIGILAVSVFTPNLIWLSSSTSRITNGGTNILSLVIVYIDDDETNLGDLLPGKSRFMFLPKLGDATYKISYINGTSTILVCQEYVEGDMYHVETLLISAQDSIYTVTIPLISDMLILKVLYVTPYSKLFKYAHCVRRTHKKTRAA